jgi:hypothetical protein
MFIFFSTSSSKKHVREFLETRTTFSKNTYEFFGKYNDVFLHADYQLFIDKIKIAYLL